MDSLCEDLHCLLSFKTCCGQFANNKREEIILKAIHMLVQLLGYFHGMH